MKPSNSPTGSERSQPRLLTALPVYNEARYVKAVLAEVERHTRPIQSDILVVDDGSTDGTSQLVSQGPDVHVVRHPVNRGYGAALRTAFDYALAHGYDRLVTIDCDGQHEPQRIPEFFAACDRAELVSGSRYLKTFEGDREPPGQRRWVNQEVTRALNQSLGLRLTDAFCGFKAYRVDGLARLELSENGYAMPLQVWVQAVKAGLSIIELPVPLIYLDETRSFGGVLDDTHTRLRHYCDVLQRSLTHAGFVLPEASPCGG